MIMTAISSFGADTFDGIDMSELDLLDIEIVQTADVMGIPETGASCCPQGQACSSCCIHPT
jgi:Thiopeptide-type bacteriocin precursor